MPLTNFVLWILTILWVCTNLKSKKTLNFQKSLCSLISCKNPLLSY
jgi:hypothetical protein